MTHMVTGATVRGRGPVRPAVLAWVAAICALCFGVVAAVALTGTSTPLDAAVRERLRGYALDHPTWRAWMGGLTHAGDSATVAVIDLVLVAACLVRGQRRAAGFVAASALVAGGTASLLRFSTGRPRPPGQLWPVAGASFPSGHATNAATVAAIVVLLSWPLASRLGRVAVLVFAVGYAGTVGLTRIAGSMHWLTDVLGGWLLAVAVTATLAAVVNAGHGAGGQSAAGRDGCPHHA